MTAFPKKIEDLLALGREHGWQVESTTYDEQIPGLAEAHLLGFLRHLDDGREFLFATAYGRRMGSRSWVVLSDEEGYAVRAEVTEPTLERIPGPFFGPDLVSRWRAVSDLRYWLADLDGLLARWREDERLPDRATLRDRLVNGSGS